MALPAVLASMITLTTTSASILGVIKRRCGACDTITQLTSKCEKLVEKKRKLLTTLERELQVPNNASGISAALDLRRDEFDEVVKNLEKMNRRTKRTHSIDRTEKFIMAQGWKEKMAAIHEELVDLRSGIETILSSWGSAQFVVTKMEKIATLDVTTKNGSRRREQRVEIGAMGGGTMNYVDRIQITMVKLTDANKVALHRYGDLEQLSLPDALYQAYECAENIDGTCRIQLLQRSAELLHPDANWRMGDLCKFGYEGIPKDLGLAVYHYRLASSRGEVVPMFELMEHYEQENDWSSVIKYITMASGMHMNWWGWFQCIQLATAYNCDDAQLLQPFRETSKSMSAFQESVSHFFGVGRPKDYQKAIDALQPFDFGLNSFQCESNNSNFFQIYQQSHGWDFHEFNILKETNRYKTAIRRYAKFLMDKNQFLPSLIFIYHNKLDLLRALKRCAFNAASNQSIDAHIIIAQFYSWNGQSNDRETKLHLQIAADAGHCVAQSICRRRFGGHAIMPKRVELVQEERDDHESNKRNRLHGKQSGKRKEKSGKRRGERASKKSDVLAK